MKWESKRSLQKRIDELETAYVELWMETQLGKRIPVAWIPNAHTARQKKLDSILAGK